MTGEAIAAIKKADDLGIGFLKLGLMLATLMHILILSTIFPLFKGPIRSPKNLGLGPWFRVEFRAAVPGLDGSEGPRQLSSHLALRTIWDYAGACGPGFNLMPFSQKQNP